MKIGGDVNYRYTSDSFPFRFRKTTPLMLAVEHGNLKAVDFLLNAGANVNAKDGGGRTPLFVAVNSQLENRYEIVKFLILSGANVTYKPPDHENILSLAFQLGGAYHVEDDGKTTDYEMVKLLMENGAHVYADETLGLLADEIERDLILSDACYEKYGKKRCLRWNITWEEDVISCYEQYGKNCPEYRKNRQEDDGTLLTSWDIFLLHERLLGISPEYAEKVRDYHFLSELKETYVKKCEQPRPKVAHFLLCKKVPIRAQPESGGFGLCLLGDAHFASQNASDMECCAFHAEIPPRCSSHFACGQRRTVSQSETIAAG